MAKRMTEECVQKRHTFTRAEMIRAIKAAEGVGLHVREIVVKPGQFHLVVDRQDEQLNPDTAGPSRVTTGPRQWPKV